MLCYVLHFCLICNFPHSGIDGTSAVTELIEFSDTILTLQFRMATSCDDDSDGSKSLAILEVSKDDGANWEQVRSVTFYLLISFSIAGNITV